MYSCIRRFRLLIAIFFLIGLVLWEVRSASAEAEEVRDPTRPAVIADGGNENLPPARFQNWSLSSTLISPRRSLAIINGRIFKTGERLDGAKIVAIQPGAVELRHGGFSHWLYSTTAIEKKSHPVEGILH